MSPAGICIDLTIHPGVTQPAVVLLHPLAMDRSIWDAHIERLAAAYPVVALDLPGHGRSCRGTEFSIEWMADEVAGALATTPFDTFVVAGMSLGGCVTQALAVRHPQLVAGACLIDTTAWYGAEAPQQWEERAQRAVRDGLGSLSEFQLARWFSPGFREQHPEVGERLLDVFRANDVGSYVATCRAMGAFDGRAGIPGIAVPVTVLVGELDPATPLPHARDLAERIPGARLRVVDGAAHMSPVERPETFVEELHALHARARGA